MQRFDYTVQDANGLHARPAGLLVREKRKYSSRVTLTANGKTADAGNLLALMGLGIKKGTRVTVEADGADETACAAALKAFFEQQL